MDILPHTAAFLVVLPDSGIELPGFIDQAPSANDRLIKAHAEKFGADVAEFLDAAMVFSRYKKSYVDLTRSPTNIRAKEPGAVAWAKDIHRYYFEAIETLIEPPHTIILELRTCQSVEFDLALPSDLLISGQRIRTGRNVPFRYISRLSGLDIRSNAGTKITYLSEMYTPDETVTVLTVDLNTDSLNSPITVKGMRALLVLTCRAIEATRSLYQAPRKTLGGQSHE